MISVEEALEKILAHVAPLGVESQPLGSTRGQVLAEDVRADFDVPPKDNSAMDGFAVQAASTHGASSAAPRRLRVIGEVAAGYLPTETVTADTSVRIMTGAPLPEGADAIVQFEHTDESEQRSRLGAAARLAEIAILQPVEVGQNVRRAGEDIARGEVVLRKGTILREAELGVAASLGRVDLPVIRRPIVALLATGDELTEVGQPLPPGKIYDSNSYSLAAQVSRYGGIPKPLGIARDTMEALSTKIDAGLDADMLVTSAGVSLGDYDVVKDVLAQRGSIGFWTVRMKPGKPLAFGVLPRSKDDPRPMPHLGLPGNPVSSMIAFEQFGRPAILKMLGKTHWMKPTVQAVLRDGIVNGDGRCVFARAMVRREGDTYYASLTGPQGSGILSSMTRANGLVVVPEDCPRVEAGDLVTVQMLDWPENPWD